MLLVVLVVVIVVEHSPTASVKYTECKNALRLRRVSRTTIWPCATWIDWLVCDCGADYHRQTKPPVEGSSAWHLVKPQSTIHNSSWRNDVLAVDSLDIESKTLSLTSSIDYTTAPGDCLNFANYILFHLKSGSSEHIKTRGLYWTKRYRLWLSASLQWMNFCIGRPFCSLSIELTAQMAQNNGNYCYENCLITLP